MWVYHQADTGAGSAPVEDDENAVVPEDDSQSSETEKGPVPYARFHEKVRESSRREEENRELRQQIARLETKLEQSTVPPAKPRSNGDTSTALSELPPPPQGASQSQTILHYVKESLRRSPDVVREVMEELGVSVDTLKEMATTVPSLAQRSAENEWKQMLAEAGLRDSSLVRMAYKAAMTEGLTPQQALELIQKDAPKAAKKSSSSVALSTGAVSSAPAEEIFPKSKRHATELALAGKTIRQPDIDEVFAHFDGKRKR